MTDKKIVSIITNTLIKKFSLFSLERQRHFSERMYRITKNKKYLPFLEKYLSLIYPQFLFYLDIFNNKKKVVQEGEKIISQMKTKSWIKYYQRVPQLRVYQRMIFYLDKFREYQVKEILNSKEYKRGSSLLASLPLRKYFLDDELIKTIPGQTTNYIFWLDYLKIVDLKNVFLSKVKKLLPQMDFKDQVYGLTHIIISDSDYYQHFVKSQKYQWIIDFLTDSIDKILTTKNKDLIGEVGVSLKLTRSSKPTVEKIKEYLRQSFNPKKGYLGQGNDWDKLEHLNIMAILLFSDFKKLYSGPDLSKSVHFKNYD